MAYKVSILDLLFFCNKFVIQHIEILEKPFWVS
jgi:hypothetical protein